MSAPVDVLAVMDREAKLARHYRIENGAVKVAEEASADATAARAAVAELIEAAALLEKSAVEHSRFLASVYTNKLNQLRDALARVKGA